MSKSVLKDIESIFNFEYPDLYYQLSDNRLLDLGVIGEDWRTEVYPLIKNNPPLLLYSNDFEVLSPKDAYDALEDLTAPDSYLRIKKDYHFIPFGMSGGGDYYCFFLNDITKQDIPIILIYHDENRAEYLAKSLQDFIFVEILQYMSEFDKYKAEDENEFKVNIGNLFKTHLPLLNHSQKECLQDISSRELKAYEIEYPSGRKESFIGFLSDKECSQLIDALAPYTKYKKWFCYSDE